MKWICEFNRKKKLIKNRDPAADPMNVYQWTAVEVLDA